MGFSFERNLKMKMKIANWKTKPLEKFNSIQIACNVI
jgi:hypothetical protein